MFPGEGRTILDGSLVKEAAAEVRHQTVDRFVARARANPHCHLCS